MNFLPREHGATAMLLTPVACAAILARQWHWSELATLTAAVATLAAKDPAVVLARQRFVWKQLHPETAAAARWFVVWVAILAVSGFVLLAIWPLRAIVAMSLGVAIFSSLAVTINVKNLQRSTLFQIVSAAALTSRCLATSLSATGSIPRWCLLLWLLLAMQASAGTLLCTRASMRGSRCAANRREASDAGLRPKSRLACWLRSARVRQARAAFIALGAAISLRTVTLYDLTPSCATPRRYSFR